MTIWFTRDLHSYENRPTYALFLKDGSPPQLTSAGVYSGGTEIWRAYSVPTVLQIELEPGTYVRLELVRPGDRDPNGYQAEIQALVEELAEIGFAGTVKAISGPWAIAVLNDHWAALCAIAKGLPLPREPLPTAEELVDSYLDLLESFDDDHLVSLSNEELKQRVKAVRIYKRSQNES